MRRQHDLRISHKRADRAGFQYFHTHARKLGLLVIELSPPLGQQVVIGIASRVVGMPVAALHVEAHQDDAPGTEPDGQMNELANF